MVRPEGEERGWHSRGYLPHLDADSLVQSITFRLADSLPSVVADGRRVQGVWATLDGNLDRSMGACWLRRPEIAAIVEASLLYFDGVRYRLLAWCIMPNHVHVLIESQSGHSFSAIVQSWKSFTAKQANQTLGRVGRFWSPDYFDRYMRDTRQLSSTIDYIESNPVKAGLVKAPTLWPWTSARRRAAKPGCGWSTLYLPD